MRSSVVNGQVITFKTRARRGDVMLVEQVECIDLLGKGRDQAGGYLVGIVESVNADGLARRLYVGNGETIDVDLTRPTWVAAAERFDVAGLRAYLDSPYRRVRLFSVVDYAMMDVYPFLRSDDPYRTT